MAAKQNLVSYDDLYDMGIPHSPSYIRAKVRNRNFPKPVRGGGIDGTPVIGIKSQFFWDKAEILVWKKAQDAKVRARAEARENGDAKRK